MQIIKHLVCFIYILKCFTSVKKGRDDVFVRENWWMLQENESSLISSVHLYADDMIIYTSDSDRVIIQSSPKDFGNKTNSSLRINQ